MNPLRYLLALFRHPSAFGDDPWGFARNQALHGYLVGGGLAWLLGAPVAIAAYAMWEAGQFLLERAMAWDCLEDFAFALCVIVAVALWRPEPLAIHAAFLAAGYFRRSANRERP